MDQRWAPVPTRNAVMRDGEPETFVPSATMPVSTLTADAALLLALVSVAAFAVLDGPTRLHRARVPIGRVLPPSWWPRDDDTVPLLAAYVGAPLIFGAGLAILVFR